MNAPRNADPGQVSAIIGIDPMAATTSSLQIGAACIERVAS
ncbi:hypothetical protein RCH23_003102 [Cryobacterium sp. CAN_C3]|nr:hypothetical protein [Cryobacterium sp. CAN_C3]